MLTLKVNETTHHDLGGDRQADSTAILDENNPQPSRIVFGVRQSGAQDSSAPGTPAAVMIHDIEQVDRPTSERYHSAISANVYSDLHVLPIRKDHQPYDTGR